MAFMTKDAFREILRDTHVYNGMLQFKPEENFLVEVAFLNYWDTEVQEKTGTSGIKTIEAYDATAEGIASAGLEIIHNSGEQANFIYTSDRSLPGQHSLIILRNDIVAYARLATYDPRTQWDLNDLANNPEVTDEEGNILFVGERTNF